MGRFFQREFSTEGMVLHVGPMKVFRSALVLLVTSVLSLSFTVPAEDLSETAYVIPHGDVLPLRWFTPTVEVDLCGHATLAAAHVVLSRCRPSVPRVTFSTRSGDLSVTRAGGFRILRILVDTGSIGRGTSTNDFISSLGHELRHAIEVLEVPSLDTTQKIYLFYVREAATRNDSFETIAAIGAGNQIRKELAR